MYKCFGGARSSKNILKAMLLIISILFLAGNVHSLPNNDHSYKSTLSEPTLSIKSCIYREDFFLEIIPNRSDDTIYYTTDGSRPNKDSTRYTKPLLISMETVVPGTLSKCTEFSIFSYNIPDNANAGTVIKAVAYSKYGEISNVVTGVYLPYNNEVINPIVNSGIDMISLTADPDDLIGYDRGILVLGKEYDEWKKTEEAAASADEQLRDYRVGANFNNRGIDWERPVFIDYIRGEDTLFSGTYGLRIRGRSSRSGPQKGFSIFSRNDYGNSYIPTTLFSESLTTNKLNIKPHDILLKDGFIMDLIENKGLSYTACNPVNLFLNGEYWGLYGIYEKYDDAYFTNHYGIDRGNVTLIKGSSMDFGSESDYADYKALRAFILSSDMSVPENYGYVLQNMDIDSFINYHCIQSYISNMDCNDFFNIMIWKAHNYKDDKWHWSLYDIDNSLKLPALNNLVQERTEQNPAFLELPLLNALIKNWDFKIRFITTYCTLINIDFNPRLLLPKYDALIERIAPSMRLNNERFGVSDKDYESYISSIRDFWTVRPEYMMEYLRETFDLEAIIDVTLDFPYQNNTIYINDSLLCYEDKGSLDMHFFKDIPVVLSSDDTIEWIITDSEGNEETRIADRIQIVPSQKTTITVNTQ